MRTRASHTQTRARQHFTRFRRPGLRRPSLLAVASSLCIALAVTSCAPVATAARPADKKHLPKPPVTTSTPAPTTTPPTTTSPTTTSPTTTSPTTTTTLPAGSPSGLPMPVTATFPSRVHVSGGRLLDANGNDLGVLKGFNVHVAATVADPSFVWPQGDYDAMAAAGARIVRHVVHWDVFEPSAGAFNATALSSLDTAIARAKAAGMYTVLSAPHLNVNRLPAWAKTEPDEWRDYVVHGQGLTQTLARRYKDEPAVIGMAPNEPPVISIARQTADMGIITGWYTPIATGWPVWVSMTAYGNGTPYPASGDVAVPAMMNALDVNGHGVIIDWHDYLNESGSYETYGAGYQWNGNIAPVQHVPGTFTAHFHGWGGNYNYPDTAATRQDFADHIAPLAQLRNTSPNFALAVGEFGMDNVQSGERAFVRDKATAYDNVGAVVQMWWLYSTSSIAGDPFSARPSGSWRQSTLDWLAAGR
jgi:hypothetical protein